MGIVWEAWSGDNILWDVGVGLYHHGMWGFETETIWKVETILGLGTISMYVVKPMVM